MPEQETLGGDESVGGGAGLVEPAQVGDECGGRLVEDASWPAALVAGDEAAGWV